MKNFTFIMALLVLLLTVGGCGGKEDPGAQVELFARLWRQGDYQAMYTMLSSQAQAETDFETFRARYANISEGIGLMGIEMSSCFSEIEDRTAIVTYTLDFKTSTVGQFSVGYHLDMVKEGETWSLNWGHQHIFPDLRPEYKIRVSRQFPQRGRILDRNSNLLAGDGQIREIGLVPGRITNRAETLAALAPLTDLSEEAIAKLLDQGWVRDNLFVPVKKVREEFWLQNRDALLAIPGVMVNQTRARVYSIPPALAQTVGYVGEVSKAQLEDLAELGFRSGDRVGQLGLESYYNRELSGVPGFRITVLDEKDTLVALVAERAVQPGQDIVTSLDLGLSIRLEDALGAHKGAALVLDAATGQIRGLVSKPGFDSNWFSFGITPAQYQEIQSLDSPFFNRALAGVYPPGSAFKPFTALMGLDSGILDPEHSWDTPVTWQKDQGWGSYFVRRVYRPGGPVNLKDAMKWSDNVYFAELALRLGWQTFRGYSEDLGFGSQIPLPLAGPPSRLGDGQTAIALADTSYGQGKMEVSPLHLALMYAALARGDGILPQPGLMAQQGFTQWQIIDISPQSIALIDQLLASIAGDPGSMGYLPVEGYRGKTGTAEISQDRQLGWYVCYKDNLVLVVMLEGDRSLYSSAAVRVAREIVIGGLN